MFWYKQKPKDIVGRITSFGEEPTPDTVVVVFEIQCELPRALLKKWILKKLDLTALIHIIRHRV